MKHTLSIDKSKPSLYLRLVAESLKETVAYKWDNVTALKLNSLTLHSPEAISRHLARANPQAGAWIVKLLIFWKFSFPSCYHFVKQIIPIPRLSLGCMVTVKHTIILSQGCMVTVKHTILLSQGCMVMVHWSRLRLIIGYGLVWTSSDMETSTRVTDTATRFE